MGSMDFPNQASAYEVGGVFVDVTRLKGDNAVVNIDATSLPHKKSLGINTC